MEEYEENKSVLGEEEDHTFVTTFNQRKHQSAPLPEGATECIKNELNRVEKHLDLTKTTQHHDMTTINDDFAETRKEQQARKLLETQFTQAPERPTTGIQEQELEQLMDLSPLAKLAMLKEENRQQ